MRYRRLTLALTLALAASGAGAPLVVTAPLAAQQRAPAPETADTAGAFLDPGAAALLNRARQARLETDRSLRSYTADVRSRVGIGLRMPLKDRTLARFESAARVRWSRDGEHIVHVVAGRAQTPEGVEPADFGPGLAPVDPGGDRFYFGFQFGDDREREEDDFWIEHPLGDEAERHYRYRSGDTLAIRLQGGREVRVIELRVLPRRMDPHTVRGVLWIDAASGALVQAAFRLARKVDILRDMAAVDEEGRRALRRVPLLTPLEFDISLMTVEYSLWDMRHWLPRAMRFEGMVRTGVLHFPAAFDVSYRVLEAVSDDDPVAGTEAELVARTIAEWAGPGDTIRTPQEGRRPLVRIAPVDRTRLLESDALPPPVWADAPGFLGDADLKEIYDRLASVPMPARPGLPVRFGWGYGEPGMLRYNRVEALSVGARVTAPLPHATLFATARLGLGDLHPNAELLLLRETMHRTIELRGFHELATSDPSRRALGAGNSFSAVLFGRDEGEYYRASGAELTMAPPPMRRRSWELRVYGEAQEAVARGTHVALPRLWTDSVFRPNISADRATQLGALLHLRPWWGTDPRRPQAGLDLLVQGETGDFDHARARLVLRGAAPLGENFRVGAEAGVASSEGSVPVQRLFYLGGASTLRGYEPGTVAGTSMARARLELARATPLANFAVFSDWGWAGDRDHSARDQRRWSVGAGASLLDGMVRLDLARGLYAPRAWRLDLHLDAVL
jgi:hypothetical protein